MPYLVLTLEEMQAKGGYDRSPAEMLTTALDAMETDGYALVTVEPAAGSQTGSTYVFHRPPADGAPTTVAPTP